MQYQPTHSAYVEWPTQATLLDAIAGIPVVFVQAQNVYGQFACCSVWCPTCTKVFVVERRLKLGANEGLVFPLVPNTTTPVRCARCSTFVYV